MQATTTTRKSNKLQKFATLQNTLPLNAAEQGENARRATKNHAACVKVACTTCGTPSVFATETELAVSGWNTLFFVGEKQTVKCPKCNR
jgi:hypothetical protein